MICVRYFIFALSLISFCSPPVFYSIFPLFLTLKKSVETKLDFSECTTKVEAF